MDCIKIYFDSWKNQNLDIVNIFTDDAIYKVKPFGEEEHNGIDNIITYWQSNPLQQIAPNPTILTIFWNENKNQCFCEFKNSYTQTDKTIKETHGMILFKLRNKKIFELSEFYKSKIIVN